MDKLAVAKGITKFVVSSSAVYVAKTSLKSLCPTETKLQEAQVMLGAYVIGALIGAKASDWAAETFDETLESIEKFKNRKNEPSE